MPRSITDQQNDIGADPLDDMLPTDAVMTQYCHIVILNAVAGMGGGIIEGGLQPMFRKLSSLDGGVNADNADLVTNWKEGFLGMSSFVKKAF